MPHISSCHNFSLHHAVSIWDILIFVLIAFSFCAPVVPITCRIQFQFSMFKEEDLKMSCERAWRQKQHDLAQPLNFVGTVEILIS